MSNPTFDMVLEKYRRLAFSLANDFRQSGLLLEDLQQESILGLFKAFERFQPERDIRFSTYAVYWIKKQILEAVKQENKQMLSTPTVPHSQAPSQPNFPSNSTKLELPSGMPELEKQILLASFVQQQSLQEIAQNLGLKVEKVKQHKQKALRRLRSMNFRI